MRKDKKQIIGEELTDEQVQRFLVCEPPDGINADFHALERAYRGMRAHDFQRFLGFFIAAGRDVDAINPQGETIAAVISRHAQGGDYLAALKSGTSA